MKQEQKFKEFCEQILTFDSSIRFVGIADEHGSILAVLERKGLKPLLNPEERSQYAITSATRQYTRLRWQYLLGNIEYATSVYEKLIRATVPITDNDNRFAYVILLSFDAGTDKFHEIIKNKIIPLVQKSKNDFLEMKKALEFV
jgi:predicted Zn-dependent protease